MRTSLEWQKYYEENARSLLEIPWHIRHELTNEEEKAISSSVQGFRQARVQKAGTYSNIQRIMRNKQVIMNMLKRSVCLFLRNNVTQEISLISCR
jgi:hypothetical protein